MLFLLIAYLYKQSTFSFTHYDDTLLYPGHDAYGFKLSQRKKMGVF